MNYKTWRLTANKKWKTWNNERMDYAFDTVKARVKKVVSDCHRLADLAKEMAFLPVESGGAGELNELQVMELIVAAHKQIEEEKREKDSRIDYINSLRNLADALEREI